MHRLHTSITFSALIFLLCLGTSSDVSANSNPNDADVTAPIIHSACETLEFCQAARGCDTAPVNIAVDASDDVTNSDAIEYAFKIDLHQDGNIDETGIEKTIKGNYPPGRHLVKWIITDEEGNSSHCEQIFIVKDCTAPKARCINGKSVDLKKDQTKIQLGVNDINLFSIDNCAISSYSLATGKKAFEETITLGCTELGMNKITLMVEDLSGQQHTCETFVYVTDLEKNCKKTNPNQTLGAAAIEVDADQKNNKSGLRLTEAKTENGPFLQLQNSPNPFNESTTIYFTLEQSTQIDFNIYDLNGKVITHKTLFGERGQNKIKVNEQTLPTVGIYYYELSTQDHRQLRKLILAD